MNMRKLAFLLALALLLGWIFPCQGISAASYLVMDADTGRVLLEQNADQKSLIASTTKIMTGYLACQLCDAEGSFTVPKQAVGIEGSSIWLREGQTVTVRTLLYGTLLQSGNDAATALAIAACGSEAAFVAQMNETARQLGLNSTHFANPHGLDDAENYSTARYLARLAAAALKNPLFAQIVSTKSVNIDGNSFVNHNKLLWRLEGAIAVKTGYTRAAGRILVSAVRRGGRTLVCVTIHDPDDWNDHAALIDAAFSHYQSLQIATAGEPVFCVPSVCGQAGYTELLAGEDLELLLLPEERVSYAWSVASVLFPPYEAGEDAGLVRVYVDRNQVAEIPVVVASSSTS